MTVTTAAYVFRLGCFKTCWKAYKVNFHMSPVPRQYLFNSSGKDPITIERSCCLGCCFTLFWADGPSNKFSLRYLLVNTRADPAAQLLVFGTPLHWRLSLKLLFTSSNSVLVLLVLADSSIACKMRALVAGCRAPQDHDSHWRWCIGC